MYIHPYEIIYCCALSGQLLYNCYVLFLAQNRETVHFYETIPEHKGS